MRNAIVDKLNRHMQNPPKTEPDVVYALVQVRKLLEHEQARSEYKTLTFFCDWVVHTELNRTEGGKKILKILDDRLGHYNPKEPWNIDPDGKVHEVVGLDMFNRELNEFCQRLHLSTDWTNDMVSWRKFMLLYGEVVRDVPVVITRKDYPFKYLKKLEIFSTEPSKATVEANPHLKLFGLNWKFTLGDGTSFNMAFTGNHVD